MPKKFPKIMFVKIENDASGPAEYFIADDSIAGMVEMGSKTKIATYKLADIVECEGIVKTTPKKRRG